ncbi:MAG TPA: hypothetical protein VIK52_14470 [Opitutaceae bacterium]
MIRLPSPDDPQFIQEFESLEFLMLTHHSTELLFSPGARAGFVEPDLDPIPRHGS